jgi:hypothetical protein
MPINQNTFEFKYAKSGKYIAEKATSLDSVAAPLLKIKSY